MRNKKIALITGGTRGIGLALVKKLVAENYEVWATYRNNVDVLERWGAKGLFLDLNQVDSIAEFVECVNQKMPHLDLSTGPCLPIPVPMQLLQS